MDCSKTGNYAEPEIRNCLIPSTYMQEEITSLQSQPALAIKWTFGQQLTTVQTSLLHPLLASGRLWEIATGWLLSSTNPPTPAGELPLSERFQVLTSLAAAYRPSPAREDLQEGTGISSGNPGQRHMAHHIVQGGLQIHLC